MIGDHRARIATMTRFYDIDAANAAVAELDGIVGVLADQRAELVRLRDEVLAGERCRRRGDDGRGGPGAAAVGFRGA